MLLLHFIYLRKKETELPPAHSLPKYLQQSGLGQAKARDWEINPDPPHGWQEPSDLSHYLPPLSVHMDRKLEMGAESGQQSLGPNPGTPTMERGRRQWDLNYYGKLPPLLLFLI